MSLGCPAVQAVGKIKGMPRAILDQRGADRAGQVGRRARRGELFSVLVTCGTAPFVRAD
jgi:hypothetical protein